MTGTSAVALWFTSYTWDLFTYTLSAILVFIFFVALDPNGNFTLPTGPGEVIVGIVVTNYLLKNNGNYVAVMAKE